MYVNAAFHLQRCLVAGRKSWAGGATWLFLPKGGWVRLRHRRWYALGQSFLSHMTSSPPSPHWKQLSSCICFCSVFIFRFFCFNFAFFTFSSFAVANAVWEGENHNTESLIIICTNSSYIRSILNSFEALKARSAPSDVSELTSYKTQQHGKGHYKIFGDFQG